MNKSTAYIVMGMERHHFEQQVMEDHTKPYTVSLTLPGHTQ